MTVPVGAAGVRGLGGRGYLAYAAGVGAMGRGSGAGGAIYGLKGDKQAEEKLYDLLPGMELTPMNPAAMSLKAATIKPAPQVTEHTWEPDSSQFTGWWALVFVFWTFSSVLSFTKVLTENSDHSLLFDELDGINLSVCQVLEELCQKNNWGQPVYQLHSAIGPDQRQLFLYKITIPALATQNPNM